MVVVYSVKLVLPEQIYIILFVYFSNLISINLTNSTKNKYDLIFDYLVPIDRLFIQIEQRK